MPVFWLRDSTAGHGRVVANEFAKRAGLRYCATARLHGQRFGGAPAYQPVFGNVGGASGALFFGGPPLQVSGQAPAELDFGTGDFSIDAWVRIVSVAPGVISPIVDKFTTPGGPGFAFYVKNQKLELNVNGSTFVSTAPNMSFADPVANTGPWYHVAVTVQRSPARVVFYINGGLAGTFTAVPTTSVSNGLDLRIGGTRLMPGTVRGGIAIDELELFNRVLTLTEVQSISNAGSAGKCRTGSLIVTKTITSQSQLVPPSTAVFPTTVSCLPSGPNVNFNLSASAPSQTVNNIPVGSTCTVTEGPLPPPLASPICFSLQWSTPTYSPGQSVVIPNSGGPQTVTIQNHFFCQPQVPPGKFTFTSGMNEFCISGSGSFNSSPQVDNPNSPFLTGNTGGVDPALSVCATDGFSSANDKVAFKYTFNTVPVRGDLLSGR